MYQYEKNKRTKKPFGKSLPNIERVTSEQIKERETHFNPVFIAISKTDLKNNRLNLNNFVSWHSSLLQTRYTTICPDTRVFEKDFRIYQQQQ